MDDNDKLEKRAKMSARIYGFLKETMLAYDREGLGFDDFLADIPYALAFIFKELDNCEDEETEETMEGETNG